ncbi:Uncharacterised protein [Streptococcus constellatus]|uniref:Uncharacterized protein n=1 Tax=Streptococcus constellatus TaxID=76860 RepID=A0A564T7I6_STRCV|nr:hypothetical protein [Streptococcus constellatus]VUX03395.1 Uncharacterised protein [Streptococcus constellatus]VUX13588.1 Uncharacterised protein [Streptococcus gordonii]
MRKTRTKSELVVGYLALFVFLSFLKAELNGCGWDVITFVSQADELSNF